ncbi:hypothetical protein EUTSA_v10004411mg [Eutrema salsugineum]|uniref:F-box associated beta-propeller type 3 domain-containing protein n=2 Tax=Eutrema salsugineum TaxID=72664 RepID=V4KKC6_EUTSA|nr:hypothetical protein EUTSA_v10004411mg [Eutrema salsugineum]
MARLPAKSLMRFKCLSKLWSCLIRSGFFSNLYLTVTSRPRQPRIYTSLVYTSSADHAECDSMEEVCHNPGKSALLSLSSSSSSNSAESLNTDLTMEELGGHNMLVLRGLILYIVCRKAFIYNPATRQSVTLPAIKSNIFAQEDYWNTVDYFLGHDPVLDQYKVVCNVVRWSESLESLTSEHWVFVLEAGGSWKKIEFDQPNLPTRPGLCINGVIYYIALNRVYRDIVISFDVRSEEFNMIQAPLVGESMGFIEYGGKPTIFGYTHLKNGMVDLWVLEDGGKWSKKSLVLQASQLQLVNAGIIDLDHLVVQCTSQNGEIILAPRPMPSSCYVLYYDPQKNDLRKVNVSGIWDFDGVGMVYIYFRHMDKSESIVHLET